MVLALEAGERGAGALREAAVDGTGVVAAVDEVVLELAQQRRAEHELVVGADLLDGAGALAGAAVVAPDAVLGGSDGAVGVTARMRRA